MDWNKLKVVSLLILLLVGFILNNLFVFLFLNLLLLFCFPEKKTSNLLFFRKPKFLFFIAFLTVVPLVITYLRNNYFLETLFLVFKMLLRVLFVLQVMGILYSGVNKDKIINHFSKIFPKFEETLYLTIETMDNLKQYIIANKTIFFRKIFWQKFLRQPVLSMKILFSKAWTIYSSEKND